MLSAKSMYQQLCIEPGSIDSFSKSEILDLWDYLAKIPLWKRDAKHRVLVDLVECRLLPNTFRG